MSPMNTQQDCKTLRRGRLGRTVSNARIYSKQYLSELLNSSLSYSVLLNLTLPKFSHLKCPTDHKRILKKWPEDLLIQILYYL